MAQVQWFYSSNGAQAGPVNDAQLKGLASTGQLKPSDLIWRDGLADWTPASTAVPALFDVPIATAVTTTQPAAAAWQPTQPSSVLPYQGGGAAISVSARSIELLRQTRPWVLFIGIMGFIFTGLCLIFAVGMGFVTTLGAARGESLLLVFLLAYLLMGVAYFFLSLYLCRFASSISRLQVSGRVDDLEAALLQQKSFWRLTGIMIIVGIVGYLVTIALVVSVGALR